MLTNTQINQAKPRERDYKLTDYEGLFLLVCARGTKLWRFGYRLRGKQKSVSCGSYPTVSLTGAREKRDAARKLLANGIDPSVQRRLDKITAAAGGNTFREVAEELLAKQGRGGR